jgi:excisionase family DNA binding protein
MANYVSLDEAAKILGISTDELVEMRSSGEIFGYRDGASWKFKQEEIDRVQAEREDLLSSDDSDDDIALDSDLRIADDNSPGSDVALVPDPSSDSGVKLVNRSSKNNENKNAGSSDLKLQAAEGSDVELGSDLMLDDAGSSGLDLASKGKKQSIENSAGSNVLGSDLGLPGGSKASKGSGSLGGELELAGDDEDDLVLGSDSAIGLGSESGINLMSPSDSGLSLEDEPLDLAGTGISGLDLGAELAADPSTGSKSSVSNVSGIGASLVDQDEEFQLTPSNSVEIDDDSGSQVIELENSESFGGVGLPEDLGVDGVVQEAGLDDGGFGAEDLAPAGAAIAMRGAAEVPYAGWQVGMLALVLLLMGLCGILTTDILRNLWAWDGQTDYSTGLTSMLVNALGSK